MNIEDVIIQYRAGEMSKQQLIKILPKTIRTVFLLSEMMKDLDMVWTIGNGEVVSEISLSLPNSERLKVKIGVDDTDGSQIPYSYVIDGKLPENEESQIFFHLLGKNGSFIDIGTNVGWYSILAALNGADVYAFEPIPHTYERLLRNIALNDLSKVRAFQMGLGDKKSGEAFYYHPMVSGASSRVDLDFLGDGGAQTVTCEIDTLDAVCRREGISRLNLIKCDVEGGELFVFRGAAETIQRFRPFVLSEMLRRWSAKFHYHPDEIIRLFAEWNYVCIALRKMEADAGGYVLERMLETTPETNFLFVPAERLPDVAAFLKIDF